MGRSQRGSWAAAGRVCPPPQPFRGSNGHHAAGEKDRRANLREKGCGSLPVHVAWGAPHTAFPPSEEKIQIRGPGPVAAAQQSRCPCYPPEVAPEAAE